MLDAGRRERKIAVEKSYFYEGVRYLTEAGSKRSNRMPLAWPSSAAKF